MNRSTLSILLFVLIAIDGFAQTINNLSEAKTTTDTLAFLRKQFPQEQVHIMTDRELYMPTDTIWLRVWTIDAETKQKSLYSNYVYVELRDAGGFLKNRVRLRADNEGNFYGYIPLHEKLTSNTYTLVGYTYHMLGSDELLFYKKPIDIITPTDMFNGITLSSLRNRKEIEDTQHIKANTSVTIDFDIPEKGQYAASVTNIAINPSDSALFITNTLPYVPHIYSEDNITNTLSKPLSLYPFEQGSVISGTVYGTVFTKKPQKNLNASIVGISNKYYDETKTNEEGRFSFNVPDIFSDKEEVGYMVQVRSKHSTKENIVFDPQPFPETLISFVPRSNHFVHLKKQEIADNELIKLWTTDSRYTKTIILDEVTVKGQTQKLRTYNPYAERSICVNDYYGKKFYSFRELGSYLALSTETEDGHTYFCESIKRTKVDVYVNDLMLYNYDINTLDGMFPMDMIMRVDLMSPFQALHLSGRSFKSNYILQIILKNDEEMGLTNNFFANFRIAKILPCQERAEFKLNKTEYAPPVILWNPTVRSTADHKAHVTFMTPDAPKSTYRVLLEGITDSGTPVHQEKYIKIEE